MSIRLITVSGPRGAGKDTVLCALETAFNLRRIVPHTTRASRGSEINGREYHFVTLSQFSEMLAHDQLVWYCKISDTQYSGTSVREFSIGGNAIVDIAPDGATELKKKVVRMGGSVLSLVIFADADVRRARIAKRQPDIGPDAVERLMQEDPASLDIQFYADNGFDVMIDNAGNDPRYACEKARKEVDAFIRGVAN